MNTMSRDGLETLRAYRHQSVSPHSADGSETSLGGLFTRLSTDTADLIRQEVSLARAEMMEVGATLARDAAKVGIAIGLALAGALALTASVVVGLGLLLGGRYWLSALIVGLTFAGVGGVLAKNAARDVKRRGLTPKVTLETLREDTAWAQQAARKLKGDLTS